MTKLSERVEWLEGPDREIDFAIGEVVIGLRHVGAGLYDTDSPSGPYYSEDGGDYPAYPRYTSSLDAAMSLVPEGISEWHCGRHSKSGQCPRTGIEIKGGGDAYMVRGREPIYVMAATPAIALCVAALKARGL